jgi:hypothetical protein
MTVFFLYAPMQGIFWLITRRDTMLYFEVHERLCPIINVERFSSEFLITGHLGGKTDGIRVNWITRHKDRWQRC